MIVIGRGPWVVGVGLVVLVVAIVEVVLVVAIVEAVAVVVDDPVVVEVVAGSCVVVATVDGSTVSPPAQLTNTRAAVTTRSIHPQLWWTARWSL